MQTILEKTNFVNILVSVAIKEKGKYLMVKEAKKEVFGLWNFPTGKVEFGEELVEAAQRECLEETGFKCKIDGLTGINFFYWEDMPGLTIRFNFSGRRISKKPLKIAKDILETCWFTLKEIHELDVNQKLRSKATSSQYSNLQKLGKTKYPLSLITKP
jgi:ADP-ribose pyrophosphatase YjhB (NUDIX family)